MEKLIRKVWTKKSSEQLMVTVPKNKGIKSGDYVEIKKV